MDADCVFCRIVKGEIPSCKVYEDESVYAFLDIAPVGAGHCLVIPREHYESLGQCPEEILNALVYRLSPIARAAVGAVNGDGYNIMHNSGRSAGQLVNHVHFHIIPRKAGDGLRHWPGGEYPAGRMEELAKLIRIC